VLKKKTKYDITTTARCPECNEEVNVGTAGPAGLREHTGKSKCKQTKEMKKKLTKEGKTRIRTLFEVGVKKAKDVPQLPVQPTASASTRERLAVPLPIIVHPTQVNSSEVAQSEGIRIKERRGCSLGWEIIDRLRLAAQRVDLNTPIAEEGDEISAYAGRANAEAHCAGVSNNDEIWETINPGLDRLLGFGRSTGEIQSIIRRGPKGIDGFSEYLEYLITEKGLDGALIEGKVSVLIDAIGGG